MRYKNIIKVPKGIRKLSQWEGFLWGMPKGWLILNKKITGCGATTMFLKDANRPIILCSHRIHLLKCKADDVMHKDEVFFFHSTSGKKEDLNDNLSRLSVELDKHLTSPFVKVLPPKILVTVDSLPHVISLLKNRGELNQYTVVSDEFQCLFSDAAFKGDVVLNYLQWLKDMPNVVFLSATPYLEKYLDQLEIFKDINYYELDWETEEPERITKPTVITKNVPSLRTELNSVIRRYKEKGFFEQKTIDGAQCKATEAVFYINSVADIIYAIKDNSLTANECNIICSSTNEKNVMRLDKIGFKVGTPQKEGEQHVVYTFCTKCAYEGIDMYHTNAYTYIFSNPNLDNLAIDVSIDLEQILGRQRLECNPFKNNATMFFLTTTNESLEKDVNFDEYIKTKYEFTLNEIQYFKRQSGKLKQFKIKQINSSHKIDGFKNDYVSIITTPNTGEAEAICNELVLLNELRAWDIRKNMYINSIQLISEVDKVANYTVCSLNELESKMTIPGSFQSKMKIYCEFRHKHPEAHREIEGSVLIPYDFHYYWNQLGHERIKANSYQESRMCEELRIAQKAADLEEMVKQKFIIGCSYSNADAKSMLQDIYDELNLKRTATATDLNSYFITQRNRAIDGIRIISVKK